MLTGEHLDVSIFSELKYYDVDSCVA